MRTSNNASKCMLAIAAVLCLAACQTTPWPTPEAPTVARRGGVTFIRPRCAEVRSCLLGQVTAAETAAPMARAAVFLEREVDGDVGKPFRISTLTDDQGVFTIADAPAGRYRLAVYKDTRKLEARGLELGAPGTTVVPVRLPPS